MKLNLGLAASLAACATALSQTAPQPAEVYLIQSSARTSSESTPSISKQLARLVFLQRLKSSGHAGSIRDATGSISEDQAVSYINDFGRPQRSLFDHVSAAEPSQLLVMIEGVTDEAKADLESSLGKMKPAFTIFNPPSPHAHDSLFEEDLGILADTPSHCPLENSINPLNDECWGGKANAVRYDVGKDPKIAKTLANNLSKLQRLASNGDMETIIVLLPETSRRASSNLWPSDQTALRRRQEEVMSASASASASAVDEPSTPNSPPIFHAAKPKGPILACYKDADSCMAATANCTGHGECQNKWATDDGNDVGGTQCFVCQCKIVIGPNNGSATHWAGPACSKVDVSVPFWLFLGFTVTILFVLTFAVGLLYSVGEEKLPGVIGAGVSKSK